MCPCCEDSGRNNYLECKCCHPRNRREAVNQQWQPPPPPISDYLPRKQNRKIKIFGPRCASSTFAVVDYNSVTLFTKPRSNMYSSHPFFEEWDCNQQTKQDIIEFTMRSEITFLKTYERNYTWPAAFKKCPLQYPRDEFSFCCLMVNTNGENQDTLKSIDYWDDYIGISPLPKEKQYQFENNWTFRLYGQDYITADLEKSSSSPVYPDEQDYQDKQHQFENNSTSRSYGQDFIKWDSEKSSSSPVYPDEQDYQEYEDYDGEFNYFNISQTVTTQQPTSTTNGYQRQTTTINPTYQDKQHQFENNSTSRSYGQDFIKWDSEKSSSSPVYPDEQDYQEYEDYDGEFNSFNISQTVTTQQPTSTTYGYQRQTTTINPTYQVNVKVEETDVTIMEYGTTTAMSTVTVDQDRVLEELEVLLQNESSIPMTSMDSAIDNVNSLFEAENVSLTGELLQKLDRLGLRVDLEGSKSAMIIRDNLAVIVVEANPQHPLKALRITTDRNDAFNNDCFDLISDEDYSQYLSSNESDAVVSLPSYLTSSNSRLSFVVFRDDRAFQHSPGRSDARVNSRILSVNVENVTKFEGGGVLTLYFRPTKSEIQRKLRRACAYWKFLEDGTGYWSEDGCSFVKSPTGILDICQCDHLTHFAEVLIVVNKFSEENEFILEVLSITGCCLSILGILLVVVTAFVFHSWRKEFSNKVWLQLCLAIFIFNGCFLIITFVEFERDIWCMATGVIMHYSLLVSFCWMLVAAIISYENLVLAFKRNITRKLLKSSIFAWGIPLLIIVILLCINHQSYMNKFEDTSRNSSFCYPTGLSLWLTVYLPLLTILLVNWSLFFAILRSMFATKKIRRHGNSKASLRSAVVSSLLVFLFGLPWIFGLIAYNVIAAYIFTVTASFQGFALFIFFIVANKRTRDLWIRKLRTEKGRSVQTTTESITLRGSGSGRVGSSNKTDPSNRAGPSNRVPSVQLQRLGAVKLRESDEIRALFQEGVLTFKTGYTRPDQKPDEYYE